MMNTTLRRYLSVLLAAALAAGCSRDYLEPEQAGRDGGLKVTLSNTGTYAVSADEAEKVAANLKLYAFQRGGGADGAFSHQVVRLARTGTTLRGPMRIGDWYMSLVAAVQGKALSQSDERFAAVGNARIVSPAVGANMAGTAMYTWQPTTNGYGNQTGSHEIWFRSVKNLPTITDNGEHVAQTAVARNVAYLMFLVNMPEKTQTAESNPASGVDPASVKLRLYGLPTTLSWEGKVLPDKANPAMLSELTLNRGSVSKAIIGGKEYLYYVRFGGIIVPAHRGDDFWAADGLSMNGSAVDTLMKKVEVEVEFAYADGQKFKSRKEIPLVPKCNRRLTVNLNVSGTAMDIEARQLPWNVEEPQDETPTEPDITNCYMVKPGRGVAIPVKGVYKAWNGLPEFTETNNPMTTTEPLVAEVIWEATADLNYGRARMEPGVIRSVRVDNPYNDWMRASVVVQTAPDKQGSALVGIRLQSDPAGEYRWSYHIWSTDYDPDAQNYTRNGVTWMDRNLGACYNLPSEEHNKMKNGASDFIYTGTYYSRGCKNPVPCATQLVPPSIPQGQHVRDIEAVAWDPAVHGSLIAWWTRHPEQIYGPDMGKWNWDEGADASTPMSRYMASLPVSLWGTAQDGTRMKKTIYDPCPEGWRVPCKQDIGYVQLQQQSSPSFKWNNTGFMTVELGYFPGAYNMLAMIGDGFEPIFENYWNGGSDLHLSDCYAGRVRISQWGQYSACISPYMMLSQHRASYPDGLNVVEPDDKDEELNWAQEFNPYYPVRCVRDDK